MSCHRVQTLLSAYMDGEVEAADSRMLESHLAVCASCSRELALLQVTARMLATAPEVEPPESLLEEIEAVTIGRASIWRRLTSGLVSMPAYGRWAAATTAAALILLAILVAMPPQRSLAPPSHRPRPIVAARPRPTTAVHPKVAAKTANKPVRIAFAPRPMRTYPRHWQSGHYRYGHRRHATMIARARPNRHGSAKPPKAEVSPADRVASAEPPAGEAVANPAPPEPAPAKEVKIILAARNPMELVQPPSDSLAQLRAEMAARNKHRNIIAPTEPFEGHKVSVDLACIRF